VPCHWWTPLMATTGKLPDKRTVDMRVMGDWVEPGSRVLDLGCGRGVLLDYLVQSKQVRAVGVDFDFEKVAACVKRGLTAYQGDLEEFLAAFPAGHFDRVICSRTLEELSRPAEVIQAALRVGRFVTIGFVNHGYWKNRVAALWHGRKPRNEVYMHAWAESRPANPVSIADFEAFCAGANLVVRRRIWLRGNWRAPCHVLPNLRAGYAVYELSR
jgi:methionine biosynthesis protein MetW